ncbi:uncharacterized protein LOC106876729 [Octopus bimaculoides]|uniref:Uncharacterized protein n=1 Tax=Octopus bimaculoides TaxID=37653 RepID=A0A0L8GHW5_OCTBM|nr:uncharacterized protein LOC106876729 [Octopus bimaculoides]|eukprot:XP_014780893.1 PREDICTED: uncharacterized protein LOC106876729 [Octopus bimaculoides]
MYIDRRQKYQVVFLIDKSLKNIRPASNNSERSQQKNSSHKFSEVSSPKSGSQNCCCHPPKSYSWKSISVSSFRILSYLFSQIQPHVISDHDTSSSANDISSNLNSRLSGAVNHLVGNSNQCNDPNDCSAENLKEQSQQIVYLKRKQASLQWGYKFFDSGKLTGKTEHHKFNDFKLRHFEEFEKELQREFEDDGSSAPTQSGSKVVDSKVNSGHSSERRKSNSPSAAECLKRTLSYAVYDFHWESPDITSPVRKIGRSSIRSSRKHSAIVSSEVSPHNLVFLFQKCPTSKMEFKDFAAKLVVDSEVFLDSFMPPALFREFRVNRNLSLYWVDQDWLKHEEKISSEMVDSINIVSEALTQLGGKLIPLDALVNTGKTYWSSVHTVTRQIEEKSSLTKNEHPKPSEQPVGFQSMSDTVGKEDTPKVNDLPRSPDSIGNKCYDQPSRCVLPVTCLLDYFISKPNNSSVTPVNNSSQICNPSSICSIQARLTYHKDERVQDLCSLLLVPSNNSFKETLIRNNSTDHDCGVNKNLVSFMGKHSLDKIMSPFEFVVENPEKLPSNSSASTSKNKFLTRSTQHPLSLQMEIYGYLETSDLNNCSDHVFFCTPLPEHSTSYPTSSTHIKQSLRTVHKGTSSKKNIKERASSKIAMFQNLLLSLTKTNLHLMVQLKIDEEAAPYIGVLEPITINLAAVTILPMGLNRQLKELFPVFPVYGHCSNSEISSACDFDKLDSVLQQYSTKIIHSKHFTKDQSDKTLPEALSSHTVFDSSILNKWTIPNAENPEMTKMSKLFCKKQLHTKEIELLKKLKQLYRKANSPSRLVDKGLLVDEKPSKPDTNQATESFSQKADNLKPCLLKKLRSFTLGPTRAEMILYKSMAVAEELSKAESEEPVSCMQQNEDSKQILNEVNTLVKCITNNNDLIDFVNQSYATSLQEKLDPWKQIYQVVNVVLNYIKPHNTDNPETETKKFLVEHLYVSCSDLRHKYKNPELEKETKIQEYKLQIILRMEIQCLQLVSDKTETLDTKDDAHSTESCVEDVVTMLRTLSFISDLTLLPFFLRDVLLKNYSHSMPQVVANIYDELMQPVPSVLADVMSPESDAPSTLCPSVSSFTVDESLREFLPNAVLQTQTKKSKTKQVLPGLGERLNRQIIVGKKSNAQAVKKRLSKSKSSSSDKKRTGAASSTKDTVRARRSLFTSDSRKLERHRSFAVTEREKSHAHRRHRHHKDSVKSKRRKTVVAETPAHKQVSQVMRRWHLLQSRLTEPLEVLAKGQSNTDHNLPLEPKSSRLVIEESPLKEIESSKLSSSECNHKTKVLIRKGFYGLSRNRLQSRNFAKYMGLADRIAGRHDRYAKLTTTTSSFTENNASSQSPLDQPNTFALSQLMGFPSPSTPKFDNTSITSNYTPNPKSEAFPFSRSPVIRKRSLDKPLVKQALFTTPEKTSMQSSTSSSVSTAHCSGDKQLKSNKLALEKSESSIFKTPTKQAPHCLKTPEKSVVTPENKQLNNFNESKVIENVSIVTQNKSCINSMSHESQRFVATSGTLKRTPVKRQNNGVHETSSVISQPKSNAVSGEEDASHRNSVSTSLNLPTKVLQTPSTPDSLDRWKRKKYYYCNREKSSNICLSSAVPNQGVADKSNRCLRLDTDYETFLNLLGNKHSKRKAGVDSNVAGFSNKRRRYNN